MGGPLGHRKEPGRGWAPITLRVHAYPSRGCDVVHAGTRGAARHTRTLISPLPSPPPLPPPPTHTDTTIHPNHTTHSTLNSVEKWLLRKNTASSRSLILACSSTRPWYVSWLADASRKSRMMRATCTLGSTPGGRASDPDPDPDPDPAPEPTAGRGGVLARGTGSAGAGSSGPSASPALAPVLAPAGSAAVDAAPEGEQAAPLDPVGTGTGDVTATTRSSSLL
jgi:hypothetical protein